MKDLEARDSKWYSEMAALLEGVLALSPGQLVPQPDTPLLGVVQELDSMAVVSILLELEEVYGIAVHDDEVDAAVFETLGSLTHFLVARVESQ